MPYDSWSHAAAQAPRRAGRAVLAAVRYVRYVRLLAGGGLVLAEDPGLAEEKVLVTDPFSSVGPGTSTRTANSVPGTRQM